MKLSNDVRVLIELDYEVMNACDRALAQLKKDSDKNKVLAFKNAHESYITTLSDLLKNNHEILFKIPELKRWIAKSRIILTSLRSNHLMWVDR